MEIRSRKTGILPWLDEHFEGIFMISGLLSIILFITWQVIYRYIITKFVARAAPPYGRRRFPATSSSGSPIWHSPWPSENARPSG